MNGLRRFGTTRFGTMKRFLFATGGAAAIVAFAVVLTGASEAVEEKPYPRASDAPVAYLLQSPGVAARPDANHDYGLGDGHISRLKPYPEVQKGDRTPFDLWRYGGRGASSSDRPTLPMPFDRWLRFNLDRKPELMADIRAYMASRYDFSGEAIEGVFMSGGWKPVMKGPVARLPEAVSSWPELATMPAHEIREQDLFPYVPLAHHEAQTATRH